MCPRFQHAWAKVVQKEAILRTRLVFSSYGNLQVVFPHDSAYRVADSDRLGFVFSTGPSNRLPIWTTPDATGFDQQPTFRLDCPSRHV